MKVWTLLLAVPVFLLSFASYVLAQEEREEPVPTEAAETIALKEEAAPAVEKKEPVIVVKEVIGEISGINKNFIAIVYYRDEKGGSEYERALAIDDKTKVKRTSDLSNLKEGDTVKVQYEATTQTNAAGESITSHVAKIISFVKSAPPPKPEPLETEEPEDREAEE